VTRSASWIFLSVVFAVPGLSQSVDLDRGRVEINGFIGTTVDTSSVFGTSAKVGGGVEAAFGVNRHVAITGDYSFNRIGQTGFLCFGPCMPLPDETIHEFMGGVRFSLPNSSRFTPYATGTVGGLRLGNFGLSSAGSSTEFALGMGLGLDVRITRRTGILVDLRGVDAVSPGIWFVQPSAGFFFRF